MKLNSIKFAITLLIFTVTVGSVAADADSVCRAIGKSGLTCVSCAEVAFCMREDGAWKGIDVAHCVTENGYSCDNKEKMCKLQGDCAGSSSAAAAFDCQQEGVFPDPYDCTVYHQCDSKTDDKPQQCPSNKRYSAKYETCISDTCRSDLYACNRVGESGAWAEDDNIYYVCRKKSTADGAELLYPVLYKCDADRKYVNGKCVSSRSRHAMSASANGPPAFATTSTICTTNRRFPDPGNCRRFVTCSNGQIVKVHCPFGTHFSSESLTCIVGKCTK